MKLDGVYKVIHQNSAYIHKVNRCSLCEHNMVVGYRPVVCGDCLELNVRCTNCKLLIPLAGSLYNEEEVESRMCENCKKNPNRKMPADSDSD